MSDIERYLEDEVCPECGDSLECWGADINPVRGNIYLSGECIGCGLEFEINVNPTFGDIEWEQREEVSDVI